MRLSQRKLKMSLSKHTNDRKKENTNPIVYKNNSLVVCAAAQNNHIPSGHKA